MCWARNTQMLVSGFSLIELAYGRKPPPLLDVETSNPEQLTTDPLERDRLDTEIARLALKAHTMRHGKQPTLSVT